MTTKGSSGSRPGVYLMPEPLVAYAARFMEHIQARHGLKAICLYSDPRAAHYQRRLLPQRPERFIEASLVARDADIPGLARELARRYRIVGIVPPGEAAVAPAARWEAQVETGWNEPAVLGRFRDKHALKSWLRATDPELPLGAFRLVRREEDLFEGGDPLPARFVLKPNDGTGNRGVGFFSRETPRRELLAFLAAGSGRPLILEERLVGREHCINGQMDEAGNPIVTQVMRDERAAANGLPNLYFVTHHVPRTDPTFAPIARYAERVMRATGLRRCPFHMEVMYDETLGPRLIEVGARLGGSDLAAACDDVHGGSFDTIAVASHYYLSDRALERTGLDWAHYDRASFAIVAGVSREAGLVHNVRGVDQVEALPEFRRWDRQVQPGDVLSPTVDLFSVPYSVHLRGYGGPAALDQVAVRVRDLVKWNVAPSAEERLAATVRRFGTRVHDRALWELRGETGLTRGQLGVRRATLRDLPSIAALHPSSFGPLGLGALVRLVRSPEGEGLTAWVDGRLAGFAAMRTLPSATVVTVAVHPDFRERGIGSRLLQEAEQRSPRPTVRVLTPPGPASRAGWYEARGYHAVGSGPGEHLGGENALALEKHVRRAASPHPALLTPAAAYGTLAAIRCLGREGISVSAADADPRSLGLGSRFVARRLRSPAQDEPEALLDWLRRFGNSEVRHVLHPTSDDTAWLFAAHRDELSTHFWMFVPPLETVYALLNKKHLHGVAAAAGCDVPETWFPGSVAEVEALSGRLPYPLVIKPQTQVFFRAGVKGLLVHSAAELVREFSNFVADERHGATLRARDPGVGIPILQQYHPRARNQVYSLSGFVDERTDTFVTRASRKLVQHPRPFGVGLCFDAAPVLPELEARVRTLCRRVGFHGAFEVEFIPTEDGRHLLNDFNPRYYGQMGFDIARGAPIPLMVHAAATGDTAWLRTLAARAMRPEPAEHGVRQYTHRFLMDVTRRAHRLTGLASRDDDRWRALLSPRGDSVDAVEDVLDEGPAARDREGHVREWARHPRAFLRTVVLGSRI